AVSEVEPLSTGFVSCSAGGGDGRGACHELGEGTTARSPVRGQEPTGAGGGHDRAGWVHRPQSLVGPHRFQIGTGKLFEGFHLGPTQVRYSPRGWAHGKLGQPRSDLFDVNRLYRHI